MQILSKYSPWQIEMAVTASLLELGFFNDKWIVSYSHFLLNNSYYDDELLSIIDDDPLYPNPQDYKKALLKKALSHLGFPELSKNQAKWLYSYYLISNYANQLENHFIFDISEVNIYENFYEFLDEDSDLQAVNDFKNIIYQLDDALDNVSLGYVQKGYNDDKTVLAMKIQFFNLCKQWIDKHQQKIETIFNELYP